MLYEYLSGEVEGWHIAPKYEELLDDRVTLIQGAVTNIDLAAQAVTIEDRPEAVSYDILVLAVGGVTNYAGVAGAEQFAIPFRKLAHADLLRQRMVAALDHVPPSLPPQDTRRALTFAVVGAGASGVELSTKMADLLRDAFERRALTGEPRVLVIEMGEKVMPGVGASIRSFVTEALNESRVRDSYADASSTPYAEHVDLRAQWLPSELETAAVVWTGGVRIDPLIERLAIKKTDRGLILVEPTLPTSVT